VTEYVEVARAESERGELVLRRRSEENAAAALELRVNGVFVMDTHETSTETELAAAALALVADPRRVVVGGLGLGFTLQRVLADPRVEEVRVVEIEEALVGWMRDGTVPHGREILADRRVQVVIADVATAIAEAQGSYDLVLLDVDNGPGYLVHEGNAGIYEEEAIRGAHRMIGPGGVLVVWSASRAPRLQQVMAEVFGDCTEHAHDVQLGARHEQYFLYSSQR
jgi:spermidine synthase